MDTLSVVEEYRNVETADCHVASAIKKGMCIEINFREIFHIPQQRYFSNSIFLINLSATDRWSTFSSEQARIEISAVILEDRYIDIEYVMEISHADNKPILKGLLANGDWWELSLSSVQAIHVLLGKAM